jgi:hypothetical protein
MEPSETALSSFLESFLGDGARGGQIVPLLSQHCQKSLMGEVLSSPSELLYTVSVFFKVHGLKNERPQPFHARLERRAEIRNEIEML